jgi:hypothetical protein
MVKIVEENSVEFEQEVEKIHRLFGDRIPNPNQYPRGFAHYLNLYKHLKSLETPPQQDIIDFT